MIGEDYKIGKTYPGDEKEILLEVKSKQPPQFERIIIKRTMKYCDKCKYLNPKEHEQPELNELHWCWAYSKPVFHDGEHPRIPTPDYCIINKDDECAKGLIAKFIEFIRNW